MMRNKKFIPLIILLMTLYGYSPCFPYAEKTHQAINEYIGQNTVNGFSLSNYLIESLGLIGGHKELLLGVDAAGKGMKTEIYKWLGYGGEQEDEPSQIWRLYLNMARNNNHFHDPLNTKWETAGLNDCLYFPDPILALVGIIVPVPHCYDGQSLVLWAQNPKQDVGGRWSWQDARKYFYVALTGRDFTGNMIASTKKER